MNKDSVKLLKEIENTSELNHYLELLSKYDKVSESVISFLTGYCNNHSIEDEIFYAIKDESLDDIVNIYSHRNKYRLAIKGAKQWEESTSEDFYESDMWEGFIDELYNNANKTIRDKAIKYCNDEFKNAGIKRKKDENPLDYIVGIFRTNANKGRFISQFKEYTTTYKNLIVIFYGIDKDVIFETI